MVNPQITNNGKPIHIQFQASCSWNHTSCPPNTLAATIIPLSNTEHSAPRSIENSSLGLGEPHHHWFPPSSLAASSHSSLVSFNRFHCGGLWSSVLRINLFSTSTYSFSDVIKYHGFKYSTLLHVFLHVRLHWAHWSLL